MMTLNKGWGVLGMLLLMPAAVVILVSVLNYGLGIRAPFEMIQPAVERWGIKDPPGLNITSLIVFGPMISLLISLSRVVEVRFAKDDSGLVLNIAVMRNKYHLIMIALSVLIGITLFVYGIGENCLC